MRTTRLPVLAATLAALGVFVSLLLGAGAASAAPPGTVTVDEGSNFTGSRSITVRYKGFGLYERIFIQQCWNGPGDAFDFSTSCQPETMIFPGLTDADEGKVTFQLFVGDDPFGAFPVSCGPKTDPSYVQYDTCYIRVVTYNQDANDRAAFFPITFAGAKAAAPTTTIAGPSASTTVAASAVTTVAASPTTVGGASPTVSVPRSITVVHRAGGRGWLQNVLFIGGVAGLLVIAYGAVKRRRQERRARALS